jgi:hypothetical protein
MGSSGNFRFSIGSYSKVPVSRGFEGHGIAPPQGIFFTDAEFQAVRESEKKEMSHLVQGMNDNPVDKEEMDELARDLRVKFVQPVQGPKKKPSRPQSDPTEQLRNAMAAGTLEPKKKKAPGAPEVWFGMLHRRSKTKWVTSNPEEANNAASKRGSRIEQLFHTQDEAEAWLFGPSARENDSDDEIPDLVPPRKATAEAYDSDSSTPSVKINKSGRNRARRKEKKRAQQAQKRPNKKDGEKETTSGTKKKSQRSASKGRRKKPRKSDSRSSNKRQGHRDDSSSDPSSSNDSENSSRASDEDSSASSSSGSYDDSSVSSNSSSDSSGDKRRRSSR